MTSVLSYVVTCLQLKYWRLLSLQLSVIDTQTHTLTKRKGSCSDPGETPPFLPKPWSHLWGVCNSWQSSHSCDTFPVLKSTPASRTELVCSVWVIKTFKVKARETVLFCRLWNLLRFDMMVLSPTWRDMVSLPTRCCGAGGCFKRVAWSLTCVTLVNAHAGVWGSFLTTESYVLR